MKNVFISDISAGEVIENIILGVGRIDELKDKNGNTYADVEFVDKSGKLKGKIWSERLDRIESASRIPGSIVKVSGVVSEFRGEKQMVVHEMFLEDKESYSISDFVVTAKKDIDDMWMVLLDYIDKVEDPEIKKLLDETIDKYGKELKTSPAYVGGLLDHMLEMFGLAEKLLETYTEANYDIITAGIIFHDLGKSQELELDGFTIKRTIKGRLIGHLILSLEIFLELAKDLEEVKRMKIEHLILSHHGILEYGSPIVPKTLEAIILHKIDDASGTIRQYKRLIDESEDGADFSNRDWAIGTDIYLN
jgi:3'-5' exoribonuclease